jgi:hypothetical protein
MVCIMKSTIPLEPEGNEGDPPVALAPSVFNINGYQSITPGAVAPTNLTTIPYRDKYTQVHQFSFGIQHEFPGNNLVSLSYVGNIARHTTRAHNMNQVPNGAGIMQIPALAGTTGCDSAGGCDVQNILIHDVQPTTFFVPYRGYALINFQENSSSVAYNSLQANFRHSFGYGLSLQAAYTWGHSIDDASSSYYFSPDDSNFRRWRATSSLNRTQVLVINYIYDLPFFKNATAPVKKTLLGGWRVSGISSFFTGEPVDFACGVTGFSTGIGGSARCNSLGPFKIKKGVTNDPQFGPTPTWFDPNMIGQVTFDQLRADNEPGMFGYLGRNPLTGPGRNNWDIALLKDFELPWFRNEHSTLQFRWETFNTFNHPQWQSVSRFCGGNTPFGQPCSGSANNLGNGEVSGAWAPRIMQLGLRFMF